MVPKQNKGYKKQAKLHAPQSVPMKSYTNVSNFAHTKFDYKQEQQNKFFPMKAKEIRDLENQLVEVIKKSDVAFLNQVLHDDLLFMAPNGQVITKAMDLASHQSGQMIVEELIPMLDEINIINDTAIVVVVYDTKGTMFGNPIQGKFRYLRIWKQFPEGIKIIGGSCVQL